MRDPGSDRDPGNARERILTRVREALEGREAIAHPGELPASAEAPAPVSTAVSASVSAPVSAPEMAGEEDRARPGEGDKVDQEHRVAAFARRLEASGGEVVRLASLEEARAWLAEFAAGFGSAAVSPTVEPAFAPSLPAAAPHEADLGVSRALAAAAQTGSLVLGSREGRRLQLLPPVHLVWLRASEVRATLGEALEAVKGDLPAALALHSGPSKSADIGGIVVRGVHGPGRLVAAVVAADDRGGSAAPAAQP